MLQFIGGIVLACALANLLLYSVNQLRIRIRHWRNVYIANQVAAFRSNVRLMERQNRPSIPAYHKRLPDFWDMVDLTLIGWPLSPKYPLRLETYFHESEIRDLKNLKNKNHVQKF